MRSIVLATVLLAASMMTGCAATVTADAYPPDLVYAAPGVQVIADYDEPIFFSDGFYWRFYGGAWYQSSYYTGGWVYARPPAAVLRINQPYAYAHYRPVGYVGRGRPVAGGWRGPAPTPVPPPRGGGWRGAPATAAPAGGGWRGGPPAAGRTPPPAAGWRGSPVAPMRPAPAMQPARPAPAPPAAHPAPRGGGWRH
jgi:hypothetical protein